MRWLLIIGAFLFALLFYAKRWAVKPYAVEKAPVVAAPATAPILPTPTAAPVEPQGVKFVSPEERNRRWIALESEYNEYGRDKSRYIAHLKAFAEGGEPRAAQKLGRMYELGQDVPADPQEALRWYSLARQQGQGVMDSGPNESMILSQVFPKNAEEQNALAWNSLNGIGRPQNIADARKWYQKSADQGDTVGQFQTGWIYENVEPKNHVLARQWIQKAADQGMPEARQWLASHP